MKKLSLLLVALLSVGLALPVVASDTSSAIWSGTVRVTDNSSSPATGVSVPFTLSTANLIAAGQLNADATGSTLLTNGGADTAYMPGWSTNPWAAYVPSIGANSALDYLLYLSNTTDLGGKVRYFPGDAGMTTSDNASLEIGSDGTIEQSGYLDTATSGNLTYKPGAFKVAEDGAGSITATIMESFIDLDGTGYLQDGDHADWDLGTGAFTLEGWFKTDSLATFRLVSAGNTTGANTAWGLGVDTSGTKLDFTQYDSGFTDYRSSAFTALTLDTWYHFAVKRSVNTLYFWLNGVAYSNAAYNKTTNANKELLIGARWSAGITSEHLDGAVNEMRVWQRALSDAEIIANYAAGHGNSPAPADTTSLVGWWHMDENTGATTADETAGGHTLTLTGGATWSDEEYLSVAAAGVASGEHTVPTSIDSPFLSLGVDATSPITPVSDNLTMNAPLWQAESEEDGSNEFTTIDSNAYTATVTGPTWTLNEGYDFDGNDDYITIPAAASINNLPAFSWEAWIYPSSTLADRWIDKSTKGARLTTGQLHTVFYAATAPGQSKDATALTANNWYHVLFTYDDAGDRLVRIYKNGAEVTYSIQTAPTGALNSDAAFNLILGTVAGYTNDLDGKLGEFRIYNKVLTPAEILRNYNSTKGKYTSGDISTYSTLASVPDNANDWAFLTGGVMPYLGSQTITIGGVTRQQIAWEYGATFTDASGSGNHATPSFRTTSSDADVGAELVSISPINKAKASGWSISQAGTMVTEAPEMDSNFYEKPVGDVAGNPFITMINSFIDQSGASRTEIWYPLAIFLICLAGLGVGKFSLAAQIIVIAILMFAAAGFLWPPWLGIFFLIPAGATLVLSRGANL